MPQARKNRFWKSFVEELKRRPLEKILLNGQGKYLS